MTDKQWRKVWLRVAEVYFNYDKPNSGGLPTNGLCATLNRIDAEAFPYEDITKKLARFAGLHQTAAWSYHWGTTGETFNRTEVQRLRCLFACLFSNMTVKEFEEICQ